MGAEVLRLVLPPFSDLADAVAETLRRNGHPYSVARLTVSRGTDPGRGLDLRPDLVPTVVVRVSPWQGPLDALPQGRRLALSSLRRNDLSPVTHIKSLSYVDGVLARAEAQRAGADDALVCNTRGLVTGATSSNLFAIIDGGLVTPPEADGVLPGVARRTVLEDAARLDIPGRERSLTPEEVASAGEVFLTNVVTGVVPVDHLDGRPIGPDAPGPLTARLAQAYWERVMRELM